MHLNSRRKKFSQRLFGYQNMFHKVVSLIFAWMVRHRDNFISVVGKVWLPRFSTMMVMKKLKRFSFFMASSCTVPFRDISFLTTSTVTISVRNLHLYLKIKRLISRLMRAVVFKPLLPLLSASIFKYKKTTSRIGFYYTQMHKSCQVNETLFCNSGPISTWNHLGQWWTR